MDKKVLKITQGALMAAIFGVMVFLNRQTAGFVQEILIYIYPLPIAIYAARYGLVPAIPASVAMAFISLFLSISPLSAFYAIASLLTGLVFGGCLYRKATAAQTMGCVMGASVVVNLVDLLFMTQISGLTLDKQAAEMQGIMDEVLGQYLGTMSQMAGNSAANQATMDQTAQMVKSLFTTDYVERMIIISTVFFGIVQGFLIYELGLLIMRRLRIKVPKPKNIYEFRPPFWTAYVAMGLFLIYVLGISYFKDNEPVRNTCMTLGVTGYMFLVIFGVIGTSLLLRKWMRGRFLPAILSILAVFVLPYFVMGIGFLYVSGLSSLFPKAEKAPEEKALPGRSTVAKNFKPDYLILVNPTHRIPDGYEEAIRPYLETYSGKAYPDVTFSAEKRTLKAFLDLKEAMAEEGVEIDLSSALRGEDVQQKIMDEYREKFGHAYAQKYVSEPGYSEHHTGLAVDICLIKDGKPVPEHENFAETELWKKIHGRIAGFGFVLRYPEGKEKITGIGYEPWHLRFVGEAAAQRMAWHELCLEEYLEKYPGK